MISKECNIIGSDFLVYEDLIGYILDGYRNNELEKIIRHKRIKIKGIREVNDRTRDIVLKNLKTKRNLFELYQLWKTPKNKLSERSEIHDFNFEEVINNIELGNLSSFEGLTNYLLSMIEIDGFEKAIHFWGINKESLKKIRLNNEIEVEHEEKKETDNNIIVKNHQKELETLEKKHSKERLKWQINKTKMDKLIKQRDNEILKLQTDKKELQKKYLNTLDELKGKFEIDKKDTTEMNNLINQRDRLKIEFEKTKTENNNLKQENIKKYEFIAELKATNMLNISVIKKLNQFIQKQKDDEIYLEPTTAPLNLKVNKEIERQNSEENVEKQVISTHEDFNQVVKNSVIQENDEQKKILVFGDITGSNFKDALFEIYTSNIMPKDISALDEDDYEAIWLIKYRFTKKGQRSSILNKFKKVKVINNFIELEGAYKNELQI